ncbi:hypothetical protein Tco_0163336 [Tanacetum coccineum]
MEDPHESFNELMDTHLDFSAFVMNRLKVDTLTPEFLAGPTFDLMKGSCKSLGAVDGRGITGLFGSMVGKLSSLERIDQQATLHAVTIEEIHVEISESSPLRPYISSLSLAKNAWAFFLDPLPERQLSCLNCPELGSPAKIIIVVPTPMTFKPSITSLKVWNNPEGQQYPHDLRKPLPLIPNSRGCRIIPFDHFINNDLVYLSGGVSSRTYTTSVTKTKAADYGHIKWIEDLFYGFAANRESARDVYSKRRIIVVTKLQIVKWLQASGLDHGKLKNLTVEERLAVNEAYSAYSNPRGFIYQNKDKKNRLMRINELHKFSDGTLNDVWTAHDDRLKEIRMKYLPQTI